MAKEKFIIEPHFRLHEWVAEEKGYFKDEGLDYEFRELVQSSDGASQQLGDKIGAMQTFERGRKSDISCACHWTVNVAATKGHGKLYGDVYQVSYLPFHVLPWDLFLVVVGAVVVCFLATLYPSRQAAKLDPAQALRYE